MSTSWIRIGLVARHRPLRQILLDGKSGQGMKIQENANGFELTQRDQQDRNQKILVGHWQCIHLRGWKTWGGIASPENDTLR